MSVMDVRHVRVIMDHLCMDVRMGMSPRTMSVLVMRISVTVVMDMFDAFMPMEMGMRFLEQ